MTNLNTSDFIRTVDHAAAMSDRWLFVAAFLLLLVLGSAVIFWLVKHLQAVICEYNVIRDGHYVSLSNIISTQNETALKLAVCIDRNTVALQECCLGLRLMRESKNP